MTNSEELKKKIIEAGRKAVEQLIKHDPEDELAADRLKNAAATKKLAVFDAFDILNKIDAEQENINISNSTDSKVETKQGFAERRSR